MNYIDHRPAEISSAAARREPTITSPSATENAGYDGISVHDGCVGNFISRNSIFSNGNNSVNGLGIDTSADGVTTTGLPLLTSAVSGGMQRR